MTGLLDHQPNAPAAEPTRILAIGADPRLLARLAARGFQVATHELDVGPAASLRGRPFTPPVTAWPFPDQAFDAVLLLDQLAFVVDDEAAIAEAARVLRPGGRLVLRVPRAGPLAWLDAYNLYRLLREGTGRGLPHLETRGIGWRRHYRLCDLQEMFGDRFRRRAARTRGLGLVEPLRLGLMVLFRWLLRRESGYRAGRPFAAALERADRRLAPGSLGYHLIVIAERLPARQRTPDSWEPR